MSNIPIKRRRRELKMRIFLAAEIGIDLLHSKQAEVTYEAGADQNQSPSQRTKGMECSNGKRVCGIPHEVLDRLPLPVEKIEKQAGGEHIYAALNRRRDDLRPRALEPLTRHHAVLNREQAQQNAIDDERT